MSIDLVIKNGKIVLPETGILNASLFIDKGKVLEIVNSTSEPDAKESYDVCGKYILPKIVDPHVHYGTMPPVRERIKAESAFGLSGGVTTFIRYFRRPESYLSSLDDQIDMGNELHYQDYAIHLTLFNDNQVSEVPQYVKRFGITSFKIYMNLKGPFGHGLRMDLQPNSRSVESHDVRFNMGFLKDVFDIAAKVPSRLRLNVHCEDGEVISHQVEKIQRMGIDGLAAWHLACPDISEALAIHQVSVLSRSFDVPIYFPHIGSSLGITALSEARELNTDFIAETAPHYLTRTIESDAHFLAKVNPPIRTYDDQMLTWKALQEGLIETIGSDHVSYTLEEKGPGTIWTTRAGFSSTGLILPLLLSEGVNRGRLSLQRLAQIMSHGPAKAFGLYPRKGTLMPGADADFVIVDTDSCWKVRARELLSTSDFSIYEGMDIQGAINSVFIRGRKVFENRELIGKPGYGQYLFRT